MSWISDIFSGFGNLSNPVPPAAQTANAKASEFKWVAAILLLLIVTAGGAVLYFRRGSGIRRLV